MRKLLESDRLLFGVLVAVLLIGLAVRNREALADTATNLVQKATEKLHGPEENAVDDRTVAAPPGIHPGVADCDPCSVGCRVMYPTCRSTSAR